MLHKGLESKGFKVHLCLAEGAPNDGVDAVRFNDRNINRILKKLRPDIIIAVWWEAAEFIAPGNTPLILDCPAPVILERVYLKEDVQELAIRKVTVFSKADAVLCSNEAQAAYYLPWLMLAGKPDAPVINVPNFSLPGIEPLKTKPFKEPTMLYAGVFWPWQNADWALNTALEEMESAENGKLLIVGGPNPYLVESLEKGRKPLLPKSSRVEWKSAVSYAELLDLHSICQASMQVFEPNMERKLSSSFRLVDSLRAGLPVFVTKGLPFSNMVADSGAGWAVEYGNEQALRNGIKRFLTEDLKEMSDSAIRLSQERFSSDKCISGLVDFCNNPVKIPWRKSWIRKISLKDRLKASPYINAILGNFFP